MKFVAAITEATFIAAKIHGAVFRIHERPEVTVCTDRNADSTIFRAQAFRAQALAPRMCDMYIGANVFGGDQVERLQIPVEFDGTAHEGSLGGRKTTFVSKKIDDNSYEFVFTDKETGKVTQTFRYTVSTLGNILTFISLNSGDAKPQLTLVYDKQ